MTHRECVWKTKELSLKTGRTVQHVVTNDPPWMRVEAQASQIEIAWGANWNQVLTLSEFGATTQDSLYTLLAHVTRLTRAGQRRAITHLDLERASKSWIWNCFSSWIKNSDQNSKQNFCLALLDLPELAERRAGNHSNLEQLEQVWNRIRSRFDLEWKRSSCAFILNFTEFEIA